MIHVYPVGDTKEHETDGTMCWCNPTLETHDPKTGAAHSEMLMIHNSDDCREVVEEAEAIIGRKP